MSEEHSITFDDLAHDCEMGQVSAREVLGELHERWEQAYYAKMAEFARETLRVSAALSACDRDNVPGIVVGEALLGYWAAQEDIAKAIRRAGDGA